MPTNVVVVCVCVRARACVCDVIKVLKLVSHSGYSHNPTIYFRLTVPQVTLCERQDFEIRGISN